MGGRVTSGGDLETSIVVPMRNASGRVERLHHRLASAPGLGRREIVLVDDGSTDGTWSEIERLAADHPHTVGIRLPERFGQTGALCAGFSVARGEVVVMTDDDLETDPDDLRHLARAVRDGADFASGRREGTRPPVRAAASTVYNARLRSWGFPFHDAGCGTDAMTLDIARELARRGWGVRDHRFKIVVTHLTDAIVEVPLQVQPTRPSQHTIGGLAASWLDVELTYGRATVPGFVAMAIAAPLATAGRLLGSPRRGVPRGPGRLTAALVLTVGAAGAARILLLRMRRQRECHTRPPWVIAERTPCSERHAPTRAGLPAERRTR